MARRGAGGSGYLDLGNIASLELTGDFTAVTKQRRSGNGTWDATWGCADSSSPFDGWQVYMFGTSRRMNLLINGGSPNDPQDTATPVDAWFTYGFSNEVGATSYHYLDGAQDGSFTGVAPNASGTAKRISSDGGPAAAKSMPDQDCDFEWACVWDVVLTADEHAALALGMHPLKVRPASIVWLWDAQVGLVDIIGGNAITEGGTWSDTDGPPIFGRGAEAIQFPSDDDGGGPTGDTLTMNPYLKHIGGLG